MIKVIITYKNDKEDYYKFKNTLALLDYQLNLSIEELNKIESFDVYN